MQNNIAMQTSRNIPNLKQTGFSLIEVLVALVVVSIGILGLAGLQHTGVRNNHNALLHSQASFLAYEIADFMRSNRAGVQAKNYDTVAAPTPTPTTTVDCEANPCTAADVASYHLTKWYQDLAIALPNGNGSINCTNNSINCTPGSSITIKISWSESGLDGKEDMSFTTEIRL